MGKILIATLGCKANQADSEAVARHYIAGGHKFARKGEPADICIVNTCTVTAKADAQCRNMIRRLRREHPSAKLIVTGCYANVAGEELASVPEADEVVPLDDLCRPESASDGRRNPRTQLYSGDFSPSAQYLNCSVQNDAFLRTRPQLKIQDGCNRFCTYCIVPYARGRSRSLPPVEVLKRLEELKAEGYAEVVLTGIHLGGYGIDLSPRTSLLELLKTVAAKLPPKANLPLADALPKLGKVNFAATSYDRNFRIRLSSIDPDEWSDELIDFVSSAPAVSPHFHIPLQSGDDDILQRMGRRYTTEDYRKLAARLTTGVDAAIGTDVIVGFPGETEGHFERTRAFIESLPLAYLHVFPYSRRKFTAAARLKETVPPAEKRRRVLVLRRLSDEKRLAFYENQIGKKLDVVIEHRRDKGTGMLKGMSGNYVPVFVEGGDELMGRMVTVVAAKLALPKLVAAEFTLPNLGRASSAATGRASSAATGRASSAATYAIGVMEPET